MVLSYERKNGGAGMIKCLSLCCVVLFVAVGCGDKGPDGLTDAEAEKVAKARHLATRTTIKNVDMAVNVYEVESGRLPTSLEALIKNDGTPGWHGPYLKGTSIPDDAWDTPLKYTVAKGGRTFAIISAGPDKQFGTDDDLTNR
jgi:general secretion pathway protein G